MHVSELRPGTLCQQGFATLLKISEVYSADPPHVSAQLLLDSGTPPPRTTVRHLDGLDIQTLLPPSDKLLRAYEAAWLPNRGRS